MTDIEHSQRVELNSAKTSERREATLLSAVVNPFRLSSIKRIPQRIYKERHRASDPTPSSIRSITRSRKTRKRLLKRVGIPHAPTCLRTLLRLCDGCLARPHRRSKQRGKGRQRGRRRTVRVCLPGRMSRETRHTARWGRGKHLSSPFFCKLNELKKKWRLF